MKILNLDNSVSNQIHDCLNIFHKALGGNLIGVYLYGSAANDGLQKFSDIDLFVVSNRNLLKKEKVELVYSLLSISGRYKKSEKRSIDATFVNIEEINPWYYPPVFDFQYGEWLRKYFENGDINPWPNKLMPDIAVLITQVLTCNHLLYGQEATNLLPKISRKDLVHSMLDQLSSWTSNIQDDTTNVLLALARIWSTFETGNIHSKSDAVNLVNPKLPNRYRPILDQANSIYIGIEEEDWEINIKEAVDCCQYMTKAITRGI